MMTNALRAHRLATLLALGAAVALSGCLTQRVKPTPSKAVADARAHRTAAPAPACPVLGDTASVGFGFGAATIGEVAQPELERVAQLLACHPQVSAVIVGQADGHGTDAEQKTLAQARAEAVAAGLRIRGVAAARLRLVQGAAPPAAEGRLVVMAEGRRW